ncbi:MAG: hypothetical protein PHX13_11350 [Thiovulaceae bacterium]|nr:hypothetical protein [Sulfurimonadaceae bacterium]
MKVCYSEVDVLIEEGRKFMTINPKDERYYFVGCDEQYKIFRNATVSYDEETKKYQIQGVQTLYNEHRDMGMSYEKLLCLHPKELIMKKKFLWFQYYRVKGTMTREVRALYTCKHEAYGFCERSAVISQTVHAS